MSLDSLTLENRRLENRRVAWIGRLGAMTRKEAASLIRQHGGIPLDRVSTEADIVVIGAEQSPDEDVAAMLTRDLRARIQAGSASLVHEHELWQQLGLVDDTAHRQLYTPAMVSGLIKSPVRNIRRWYRMGLLQPSKVAHRLPYFDFEQVQSAKQLVQWIGRGAKASDIKRHLAHFAPWIENRSLIDLDLVVDGRRILLREAGKLVGAHGQLHLDFEDKDTADSSQSVAERPTLAITMHRSQTDEGDGALLSSAHEIENLTRDDLLQLIEEMEDAGRLEVAIEWYRVLLARFGLQAEIAFQLAELLYRSGDISAARERYYNAIELDEDFVEARANLGCVLAETGQLDLAVAAFEGAIVRDDQYPDVHYHLARCLDELSLADQATKHWLRFVQLSPQSPWADEALERLGKL